MTVIDVLILTAALLALIVVAGVMVLINAAKYQPIEFDTVTRGQN